MAGYGQGLYMGVLLDVEVHAVGMDEQQVLGLQGVGHCLFDQGGCDHDGVGSVEGEVDQDDHEL